MLFLTFQTWRGRRPPPSCSLWLYLWCHYVQTEQTYSYSPPWKDLSAASPLPEKQHIHARINLGVCFKFRRMCLFCVCTSPAVVCELIVILQDPPPWQYTVDVISCLLRMALSSSCEGTYSRPRTRLKASWENTA